jgi:hypothetical protein
MLGLPEDGSPGTSPAPPPDWPQPGTPLPGEEPTVELPVVTEAMLASRPVRRIPALERRGPRPAAAPVPATALDDLLTHSDDPGRPDPAAADARAAAEPGHRWMVGAGIAAAALLLTGTTVVLLSRDNGPGAAGPSGWSPPVAAAPAPPPHTATAALNGRTDAGFDLVDGARHVTVRAADLGDSLYRISTPEADPVVPRAEEQDGRVRLSLDGDAQSVDIALNAAVRWDLRVAGGAELSTIDLSAGRVGGVELTGGASRIELSLPRPAGTLSVRMSGGVSLFDVRTTGRTPVRVRVGRGAGQVTLNGQHHAGVAAGETFTPAAWGAAVDRVDVDAAAGMSALTVAPY